MTLRTSCAASRTAGFDEKQEPDPLWDRALCFLVYFVCLVYLVEQNKQNRPDEPDALSEQASREYSFRL
jgi:fructoselysine-6-P-deglycase FrlB-like protein